MSVQNPVAEVAELDNLGVSRRRAERWLVYLTAFGIGLRVFVFLLRQPIWTDEAKLAASLLDRGFAGLLEPLYYSQIAPVLFMWIQKTATLLLGYSEYSLRLFPLATAIAGVLLMRHLTRRLLTGAPAIFAMALFAVSYYPVRHSAELKPYATDLFVSLALTALAVEWLRTRESRWLWIFAAAAPVALALSYPATFIAVGILAALALPVWRERNWRGEAVLAAGALSTGMAFAANYFLIALKHREARLDTNPEWLGGFPPLDDPLGAVGWLLQAHTGRTFGYPVGGENGGSLLAFVAFVVGAVVLYKATRRSLLAVLLFPFLAGIGAAVLQQYPYGGSGRVSQHLVPAICLLAGVGAARLTSLAKSAATRRRAQTVVLRCLVGFGILLATVATVRPYRDRPDRVARDFARWFWETQSTDAELVDGWEDLRLEFARPGGDWTPGGAGYRVNQWIYFERRRSGAAPDLENVSSQRPLRVAFLGSSVARRQAALEDWLRDMRARYDLVGEESHDLGRFKEQHGTGDWVRVYTFVPRSPDRQRI